MQMASSPWHTENPLCSSERDAVRDEEENDMLLYMWQKAAFMDSGQGIPREMADSLRLRIAQLSSYHTKLRESGRDSFGTEQLLKDYLDRYSRVVDERSDSKGMNNFKQTMDIVLAGKTLGQREWKSSLQFSTVKEMPEYKAVLKEAETYSKNHPSLERGIPFPARTISAHHPMAPSAPPPAAQTALRHPRPQEVASKSGPRSPNQRTQRRGLFQYTSGTSGSALDISHGSLGSSGGGVRGSNSAWAPGPPLKRSRAATEENTLDDGEKDRVKLQEFSTASDEYARQQRCKYGGRNGGVCSDGATGSLNPGSYGSSKKVLGTRSRFVPPVRRDGDRNSSEADIRSRILKGGGGSSTNPNLPPELEGDEKLRNIEPRMVELIMNEIMDHGAPVEWTDIAGLEFAKATIKEIVVWPMMRPDLFTGLRGPPKGILLFGPPGTGKTLIGKCIASQVDATFFSISASSLTSKWIGEGEKMVRALFAVARCFQPAVIFMDEIDSLLTQRSDTEHESSRRIKTEFLVQLDGATTSDADRLLVIGATNRPQEIDEAARRRLVKRLYIPLPEAPARKLIVLHLMKQQPFHLADEELDLICCRTGGYSGADMTNLCREAAYGPIREAASSIQHISADDMREVLYKDFEAALQVVRPSVAGKDLDVYIEWNRQFGCGGI